MTKKKAKSAQQAHDVVVDEYGEHVCVVCRYIGFTPPPLPCPGRPGGRPKPENCPNHVEVQHHDRKLPWCDTCGWRSEQPAVQLGTPRVKGTVSDAPATPRVWSA